MLNFSFLFIIATVSFSGSLGFNFIQLPFDFDSITFEVIKNASEKCQDDLMEYQAALQNLTANPWALQMLDSNAKIPEGILQGTFNDFGNFDECLAVVSTNFTGKYCMIDIQAPLKTTQGIESPIVKYQNKQKELRKGSPKDEEPPPNPLAPAVVFSYGLCIPSSCTAEDLNKVFGIETIAKHANIKADDHSCYTSEKQDWSPGSWAFISFGIVLIVLAALSTLYELYAICIEHNGSPNRILTSFSIYKNTAELIKIRERGEMDCLHGMRTLSMMWVVLCHTYLNNSSAPRINLVEGYKILTSTDYVVVSNGYFSVDSFFLMSGLLVAFVFFRNIARSGSFDVPVSYIHRYLRLTPGFLVMVLFNMTLYAEMGQGPLYYKTTNPVVETCEENWWGGMIYLQNYINATATTCLGQSWYLFADMQMYWISPIFLYPLLLWPMYGVIFLGFIIVAATAWTLTLAYLNDYKATTFLMTNFGQFSNDYVATHARLAPWLLGLALGFGICAIKSRKMPIRLSKLTVALGWLSSTGVCLGCLYGVLRFSQNTDATEVEHAAYLALVRVGWGLGLGWVVFACIYGYGGIVNTFLSLGIFQPLGKLSYNVFLVHVTFLTYRTAVARTNGYFSDLDTVYEFLATLVMSNLFGAVLYLLIEAPVANLDKEILGNLKILPYPRKSKPSSQEINVESGENTK